MAERKTVVVSGKSWHGRVYRYWLDNGRSGFRWACGQRRENLCHYVRVVLLWAPLAWLAFAVPKKRLRWLRPWMPLALAVFATGLTISAMRWPTGTWELVVAIGIWLVGCAVLGAIVFGLVSYLDSDTHKRRKAERRKRRSAPDNGDGFATVAMSFLSAKKARICPFIERRDMP